MLGIAHLTDVRAAWSWKSSAGEVGGAFWIAFAVGVSVAAITGLAYAELATKYPKAAGAALYVHKAFGKRPLAFLVTVCFLSASFAAAGFRRG